MHQDIVSHKSDDYNSESQRDKESQRPGKVGPIRVFELLGGVDVIRVLTLACNFFHIIGLCWVLEDNLRFSMVVGRLMEVAFSPIKGRISFQVVSPCLSAAVAEDASDS